MHNKEKEIVSTLKNAEKLHGHLGPFLVIGVRMGNLAKRILKANIKEDKLEVDAKIPLSPPVSCILDGLQATTKCTIGNQKLKIENSQKEITVRFKLQNSDKTAVIAVNQKTVEELKSKLSRGISDREIAQEITLMPESQLFRIKKQ